MVGPSNILTVSYGTFSCTLEGFDDSFELMKSIAEYFRDLAAEDRYFGAEPPSPDAEMLAQMAEGEIRRQVEARTNGNEVVLRTGQALTDERASQTPIAALNAQPAPAVDTGRDPAPELAPSAPAAAHANVAHQSALHGEVIPPTADDSVAAKLRRIRAAVSDQTATTAFAEDVSTGDLAPTFFDEETDPDVAYMAEEDGLPTSSGLDEAMNTAADDEAVAEIHEDEVAEVEADAPEALDDGAADVEAVEEDTPEAEFEAEEERAAEAETEAEVEAEVEEELVAADGSSDDDASDVVAEAEAEDVQAHPAEEAAEVASADRDEAFEDEAGSAPLDLDAFKMAETEAEPEVAEEQPLDADADQSEQDDFEASLTAALAAHEDAPEAEVAAEADVAEADDDFEAALSAAMTDEADDGEVASDDDQSDDDADTAEAATDEDEKPNLIRRVFSLRRPVSTVLPNTPVEEEVEAEVSEADEAALDDTNVDEAEVAELAALDGAEDIPVEDEVAETAEAFTSDSDEAERIFAQAEDALDEPEGRNRRNAIAQLKAAVAATEAARTLGEPEDGETEKEDPYRDDLSRVVRPRRRSPEDVSGPRSERPKSAPLKLVASQRVDLEEDAAVEEEAAAVMPRRVSVRDLERREAEVAENPEGASRSFTEYAQSVGASGLSELLEAAAAYTSFVEKRESFSRPQIIRKIREMHGDEFSREDSLRSFGALLRQGRITKLRGGQFQVTEDTRFRPSEGDPDLAVGE